MKDNKKLEIIVADYAGFCFGVKRATELAEKSVSENKEVHTLGEIIHNPQEVRRLNDKGVLVAESLDSVSEGTIIIRAHGVAPDIFSKAKDKGLKVADATCPFVVLVQKKAQKLHKEGLQVVVVGEKGHPEVIGIEGYTKGTALVVGSPNDAMQVTGYKKIGVVSQTTQSKENFEKIVDILKVNNLEVIAHNTICSATNERQKSARELTKKVEIMLIVGGKGSGNTKRLYEICKNTNKKTYWVETEEEVEASWFKNTSKIGLTAGASTPDWVIDKVITKIKSFG